MSPDPATADALIAGAGPAGAALAVRLAQAGLHVALLDARPRDPKLWADRPGERLPSSARFVLDALGVAWEQIALPQIEAQSLWFGRDPEDISNPAAPALLLSRRDLDAALVARAEAAGARLVNGVTVQAVSGAPGAWRVEARGCGDTLRFCVPFLVDATGRRAALSAMLGLAPARRADPLIALVRWWSHATETARPFFLIEAMKGGWWYAASLLGGCGVAGFLTMGPLLTGRPEAAWRRAIDDTAMIRRRVPDSGWGDIAAFAAAPARLERVLGPGWAVIGDAALQSDPIEGEGVLRALATAEQLSSVLLAAERNQAARAQEYDSALALNHERHLVLRYKTYMQSDRLGERFLSLVADPPDAQLA